MENFDKLRQQVIEGDVQGAEATAKTALAGGMAPGEILSEYLIPSMAEVGRKMACHEYFLPEVLMSAEAMYAGLSILRPLLVQSGHSSLGKVVLGTVRGDVHDIGKSLVGAMLEGGGFEVIDLGADVEPDQFVQAVKEHSPDLVGLSAMLTTTMREMQTTISALSESGLRHKTRVMVGGAPVSQGYADKIGADGYCQDCTQVVETAARLLGRSRPVAGKP